MPSITTALGMGEIAHSNSKSDHFSSSDDAFWADQFLGPHGLRYIINVF